MTSNNHSLVVYQETNATGGWTIQKTWNQPRDRWADEAWNQYMFWQDAFSRMKITDDMDDRQKLDAFVDALLQAKMDYS